MSIDAATSNETCLGACNATKAFLHAACHLRAPWRWGYALRWFPGFVLNVAYRTVAALRYRIWGHADACGLVTPEQRRRFLP